MKTLKTKKKCCLKRKINHKPGFRFAHPHSMLHQTLPTFLSIQSSYSPSSIHSQVKREMEGVVTKALKTSFWPEINHEPVSEDVCWVENVIPGDDFSVDDLLDFSKEEVFNEDHEEEKDFVSVSSHEEDDTHNENENSNGVSLKDDFSELSVPADDVEQLEWLSHFVEDSFSVVYPKFVKSENPGEVLNKKPENLVTTTTTIATPGKARSKRTRTGGRVWSLGASSGERETTSGSSSSSISSGSSASTSCLIFSNATPNLDCFYRFDVNNIMNHHHKQSPAKRQKKKRRVVETGGYGRDAAHVQHVQRRCSHCGVQKTPQWRAGPNGAKTLCNACGVRYKSGRLLPEYRPACSPSFSREVHSNSHRKVLEMRKKKQMVGPAACGSFVQSPVQSY